MSGFKEGQRSVGGGRSSYRHPAEIAEFDEALTDVGRGQARARHKRHAERVAAKIAQREQERAEGKIP
jgi:hypothetical protein